MEEVTGTDRPYVAADSHLNGHGAETSVPREMGIALQRNDPAARWLVAARRPYRVGVDGSAVAGKEMRDGKTLQVCGGGGCGLGVDGFRGDPRSSASRDHGVSRDQGAAGVVPQHHAVVGVPRCGEHRPSSRAGHALSFDQGTSRSRSPRACRVVFRSRRGVNPAPGRLHRLSRRAGLGPSARSGRPGARPGCEVGQRRGTPASSQAGRSAHPAGRSFVGRLQASQTAGRGRSARLKANYDDTGWSTGTNSGWTVMPWSRRTGSSTCCRIGRSSSHLGVV